MVFVCFLYEVEQQKRRANKGDIPRTTNDRKWICAQNDALQPALVPGSVGCLNSVPVDVGCLTKVCLNRARVVVCGVWGAARSSLRKCFRRGFHFVFGGLVLNACYFLAYRFVLLSLLLFPSLCTPPHPHTLHLLLFLRPPCPHHQSPWL